MKIRIKGNSIRFRLTRSEVSDFAKTGIITEKTVLPNKPFFYALEAKSGIQELAAEFLNDTIVIYFPKEYQKDWAVNKKVGYSNHVSQTDQEKLSLLVEKDFTCLDNTVEDQSDNYPNPRLKA